MDEKMMVLMESMITGDSGLAIERSEKREQMRTVRSHRLPLRANEHIVPRDFRNKNVDRSMKFEEYYPIEQNNIKEWTMNQYETMGIKVLDEYDDLFLSVELPEGWDIRPTEHSMWSEVVDEQGRIRITFFYKGAFYDRSAFSSFERRYTYKELPFDEYKTSASYKERKSREWYGKVYDAGKEIFSTEPMYFDEESYFNKTELHEKCEEFLKSNYPDHEDINAYWDK